MHMKIRAHETSVIEIFQPLSCCGCQRVARIERLEAYLDKQTLQGIMIKDHFVLLSTETCKSHSKRELTKCSKSKNLKARNYKAANL